MAPIVEAKCPTAITVRRGLGTRPTSASVAITSVPSDPTTNGARLNAGSAASRSSRYPQARRQCGG
jgi:hypothetical protein